MMTYHVTMSIAITPSPDMLPCPVTELPDGRFQCAMSADEAANIDACEQAVLQTTYPALRQALATYCTTLSSRHISALCSR